MHIAEGLFSAAFEDVVAWLLGYYAPDTTCCVVILAQGQGRFPYNGRLHDGICLSVGRRGSCARLVHSLMLLVCLEVLVVAVLGSCPDKFRGAQLRVRSLGLGLEGLQVACDWVLDLGRASAMSPQHIDCVAVIGKADVRVCSGIGQKCAGCCLVDVLHLETVLLETSVGLRMGLSLSAFEFIF